MLTIDPRRFPARWWPPTAPTSSAGRPPARSATAAGATAAINAGYFVLDPAAGAPGDPAGVGVYGGRLLSETIDRRPALVLRDDARRT